MFAQDHQLQVCTEPFQTRMKIKFKSQISCGFGFFSSSFRRCCFPSFLREKREAKPPRLHVRRTRSLCTSSHSGQLGGCGMVGAGTGHSTPQHRWPPAWLSPARGRMRWLTSRFACLRTASSVYRPTRRLCEAGAAAAGGGCGKGVLRCSQSPESPDLFILLWLPQPKPRGWTLHGDTWSAPA